ncbi:MAG: sterol desaturase family protein [Myxococcota bacterium]
MIKIIPLAIPVFFTLIGLELLIARAQGRPDYLRFSDAITALSCGVGNQVVKVFTGAALLVLYWWVHQSIGSHGLLPWGPWSVLGWAFAILALDHQYYWWHRHSHRVNAMWAAHIVHHHSQEYNLAVALRQAMFTNITSIPYYLPLAVLGVPVEVFGLSAAINTLYQFWIHTRTVGKLGPLEWVLNTPSHHRVHHGINPEYIDKSYGGMLIIWDRLYGTFTEEQQEPVYGTVVPLESYDPIWANFHYWVYLWKMAVQAPSWWDKVRVWFMPPEWSPQGIKTIPPVDAETFQKWNVPLASGLGAYVLTQTITVGIVGTVWILWMEDEASLPWLTLLGVLILWATWSWGQLFHRRGVGIISEVVRLALVPACVAVLVGSGVTWLPLVSFSGVFAAVSIGWVLWMRTSWTAPYAQEPTGSVTMAAVPGK